MHHRESRSSTLLSGLLLIALGACSDAPRPVEGPVADPHRQGPSEAVFDLHPASFSGRVVMTGELADKQEGVLMISVVPAGQRMPLMATRLDLQRAPAAEEGRRVVPFRLDSHNDMMGGGLPAEAMGIELELSVRYDADGVVETKEGDVTVNVPVELNATEVEVALGG